MEAIAVVTLLALIEYLVFGVQVGLARSKAGVVAPATTGDPIFERTFRVQQNTLERLVVFVPALWLFGHYVQPLVGAALGLVFVVGRFVYARGYVAEPGKRGTGFLIGEVAQALLVLGALGGALRAWLA